MSNHSKQYLDFNGLSTYHEGTKILHGYYNSSNGNFYKESTYTTLISPQEKRLYIDLGSDIIYEYKNNAYVALTGTGSYNNLSNKPSINNVSLSGNKSLNDLGVASEDSVEIEEFNNKTPYIYRKSAGGDRVYEKLIGGTIAWNQLVVASGSFSFDRDTQRARNLSTSNVIPVIGHKYFFSMNVVSENLTGSMYAQYGGNLGFTHGTGIKNAIYSASTATPNSVYVYMALDESSGAQATIKDVMVIDLTAMFGSTIADHIYSLEQATAGAGVVYFRQMFPNDYYAYDTGTLQSVNVASKKVVGFNQWDEEWEVGNISTSTGEPQNSSIYIRSKNFCACIGGQTYYVKGTGQIVIYFYDADENYIEYQVSSTTIVSPINACFFKIRNNATTYNNDICINISNASKNGTYEPYEEHTYTFDSDLTLRGIPKLDASNNLYYDGDVYESDGTVTRRYGIVDLGTVNWDKYTNSSKTYFRTSAQLPDAKKSDSPSTTHNLICSNYKEDSWSHVVDSSGYDGNICIGWLNNAYIAIYDSRYVDASAIDFKTAMSGVYLVYELNTPTTESADTYINPQIVDADGTEEFIDYMQSQSTRDVAVPVGHESKYIVFPEWLRNKYFNDLYDKAAGDHTHNSATTTNAGFMSSTDKTKLDGIATNATNVESSSTNGNIKINGTETTVYTHPAGTNPHGTTKSDVGLGNVGNFKAVSTVANQGLSSSEQTNARANIGAGTSSFSGNYDDLSNKPIIDTTVTESSSNLITSGAVYTAIDNLPNPMVFKGTLGSGGTITSLPTASSSNEGYTYKVITAGLYASQSAKVGDVFVSNGSSWVLIPAGDEDTDTWRNIKVNGTELLGTGISTGYVNFKNGNGITTSGSGHDVTIGHSNSITAGTAKGDDSKTLEFGGTFTIPSVTYDAQGHITAKGTTTMTMPANPNTDTKVTSSTNHYTPSTASGSDITKTASGATAAWSIDVVKGVTLNTDGKGHVTGMSVTSGKIPANPNTNTWRNIKINGTQQFSTATSSGALDLVDGIGTKAQYLSSTGTVRYNADLQSNVASALGATAMGSTANRQYAVGLDSNNNLSVNIPWTDTQVTQTATTTNANYEILFSKTADNTTRTEEARKANNLKFNPSTGNLQTTQLNGVTIGTEPKFTDTVTSVTYSAGILTITNS